MRYTDANAEAIARRARARARRRNGPPCLCPMCERPDLFGPPVEPPARDYVLLVTFAAAIALTVGAALALILSAIQGV